MRQAKSHERFSQTHKRVTRIRDKHAGQPRGQTKLRKTVRQTALDNRLAELAMEQAEEMELLPAHVKKLISGYELRCFHFEIFESLRKLALVGAPIMFPPGSMGQSFFALLICFATFGMYTSYAPYVKDSDDRRLSQLCQIQIFFTLLTALALRSDRSESTS